MEFSIIIWTNSVDFNLQLDFGDVDHKNYNRIQDTVGKYGNNPPIDT